MHSDLQCQQAVPIAKLEVTTQQISKTLERLGTVLEKIAEQSTRVSTLEENQELIFARVRAVELNAAKEETKMGAIVAGVAVFVSVITGIVLKYFGK